MATASLAVAAGRSWLFLALLMALAMPVGARAGSIFDDDYAPQPARTTPSAKTSHPPDSTPPPTNETPPATAPAAKPEESPAKTAAQSIAQQPALAVPAAADQAKSRKLFKEAFADDLKNRTPAGRRGLANKLLAEAEKLTDNPCDRFVLLVGACYAAAEGSDLRLAANAAARAATLYNVDALRLAVDATLKAPLKAAAPIQAPRSVQAGLEMERKLAQADDYATAARVLAALQPLAATNRAAESLLKERVKQLGEMRATWDSAVSAKERLAKAPGDPTANSAMGEFLCFVKGDFENGLPPLTRGGDSAMSATAALDLAGASEPDRQIAIGDGWWKLAEKGGRELYREGMRQRAAFWYEKALASSAVTGLSREMLEKRVADSLFSSEHPRTVDLLPIFDPSKDVVAGQWNMEASAKRPVLANRRGEMCRVQFPYQPPDEYDFRATFISTSNQETMAIILMCPLSDGSIMWCVEFNHSAFFESRGKRVVAGEAPPVTRGEQYTTLVKVRKDKIQGYLNDRLFCEFDRRGQAAPAISPDWNLRDTSLLGIGVWNNDVTFSNVELVEISGPGTRLR